MFACHRNPTESCRSRVIYGADCGGGTGFALKVLNTAHKKDIGPGVVSILWITESNTLCLPNEVCRRTWCAITLTD
jgi:hypothetical protein